MTAPKKEQLQVRALSDAKGGVVVRSASFLLINMNTIDPDGNITGIVTIDFQGDELPTPDDLKAELLLVGTWNEHPKHGPQFSVEAWAISDTPMVQEKPVVRYKAAKRLSADDIKRLMSKDRNPK